jgi:type I restriction enzyme M protein
MKLINEKKVWKLFNIMRGNVLTDNFSELVICLSFIQLFDIKKINLEKKNSDLYVFAKQMIGRYDSKVIEKITIYLKDLSKKEMADLIILLIDEKELRFSYKLFNLKPYESSNDNIGNLAIELLNIETGDFIFDLGSGIGSFLARAYKYALEKGIVLESLGGSDINIDLVNFSNMFLTILKDNDIESSIEYSNALKDEVNAPFSKGFVYPPFGMKFIFDNSELKTKFPDIKFNSRNTSDWVFVDKLIEKSDSNKNFRKAVAVVIARSLFNDADKKYRNSLIQSGTLEGIIELPQGTLAPYNLIKVCILVLSKGNKKVKIVDASNILQNNPIRFNQVELPIENILKIYNSKAVERKTIDELIDLPNLLPSNIFIKTSSVKNGVPLSEISEVFTGSQYTNKKFTSMFSNVPTGYRILTSSDIEHGLIKWKNLQSIDYKDDKFDKFALKKNDLIITSKSSKVKTAVVDINLDEKILVTGGIIIVRPNIKKVDPTYLKIYFDSDEGKNVIEKIQRGITTVTLNAKDLKSVLIPMISLEKQKKQALIYNNKLTTLLAYKTKVEELETSLRNFYLESMEDY